LLLRSSRPAGRAGTDQQADRPDPVRFRADGRAVSAKHNPPQDIDGLLAWVAGTDENGIHVVTVWQSKAHMDRWTAEQLFPAFQSLGMTDVASNMEFTEYDADELYIR
jgi:hypothetical protein